MHKIILASNSKVRKKILDENGIECKVFPSNVDEELIKESLMKENASPELISKNLAELKANKISLKFNNEIVLGADSVIDINRELVSKPKNREEALKILKKLNGKTHHLISSICISKNGSMIWNYTDKAALTMKNMTDQQLKEYLFKIKDEALYSYNVYQIEGEGRSLFSKIEGDENTIMGLPVKKIKDYLRRFRMKKYLVIGNPIEHSLSPKLHNYWIKKNNIEAVYDKKQINESDIKFVIDEIKNEKINGINVTVPFKKSTLFHSWMNLVPKQTSHNLLIQFISKAER